MHCCLKLVLRQGNNIHGNIHTLDRGRCQVEGEEGLQNYEWRNKAVSKIATWLLGISVAMSHAVWAEGNATMMLFAILVHVVILTYFK